MDEEQARIRGYLVAQGAKLTPAGIVEKVRAAMADLRAAAAAVPPARFGERPAPEEWSGNEVMAHVVAADGYFGGGIRRVLAGQTPPPRPGRRGVEGAPLLPAEAWYRTLAEQREALFAAVQAADPAAAPDQRIDHPIFGPLTWRETLLFTRLHDLDHAGQLQKIATALAAAPPA
ncbi:MAG TPA: DinB family protein [Candidatus Deferrimicrobiaceae bacterium]|nr:DinB family protein [Candidatus Deferrimicrobiaceae bacterium]